MTDAAQNPLLIHGTGNSVRIAALALAAAGFTPSLYLPENSSATDAPRDMWSSVLALSPAAKTMLEQLGVWPALTQPATPVCDMAVYGSAENWQRKNGLSFADPTRADATRGDPTPADPGRADAALDILAHIVSLVDLSAAIAATLDKAIAAKRVNLLGAPITAFDKTSGATLLEDDTKINASLLIDCDRSPQNWRRDMGSLTHNYEMAALVAAVETDARHANAAVQLFLPDGPLALLPLPDKNQRALIWSLPKAKALALADVKEDIFLRALDHATQKQVGPRKLAAPRNVQNLALKMADVFEGGHLCLLGDAVHMVHPMAGQGFNLTLRDAALLADCLYDAKTLGLAANGPYVLKEFAKQRRNDAALTATLTHGLAQLFSGPLAKLSGPLGRLGLALTGKLAARQPKLRAAFRAQADGQNSDKGAGPEGHEGQAPRLMRGQDFTPISF